MLSENLFLMCSFPRTNTTTTVVSRCSISAPPHFPVSTSVMFDAFFKTVIIQFNNRRRTNPNSAENEKKVENVFHWSLIVTFG